MFTGCSLVDVQQVVGFASVDELAGPEAKEGLTDTRGRTRLFGEERGLIVGCTKVARLRGGSNWTYSPQRRDVRSGDVRGSLRE